ncbi:uncharacterized protein LOC108021997 [Drosophila biarmipes]|uniref:uncharacterized protein LOC108021997 n=1 Tax=Drosophila biarmipes TaxID=125945 RepID=UPI0007E88CD0|nr:uncharacterized protein LOC108021997 [Drosophila biarmipes]
MATPRSILFSGNPDGDFEGLIGAINKLVLKGYQLIDLVLNRTETHYDTTMVAGLVSLAVVIGAGVLLTIMHRQKYQSIVNGAPILKGDEIVPNLNCDETTEDEETEDSGEADEGEADEEGESDTLVSEDYLDESVSDEATDGSEELELENLQIAKVPPLDISQFDEPDDAAVPVPSRPKSPLKSSGIKPVATMYSKEESYKVIPVREASPMEPLNKVMTSSALANLNRRAPTPAPKPAPLKRVRI